MGVLLESFQLILTAHVESINMEFYTDRDLPNFGSRRFTPIWMTKYI